MVTVEQFVSQMLNPTWLVVDLKLDPALVQEDRQEDTRQASYFSYLTQSYTFYIVRKVKLTGGNLVLDNPVPTKYLQRVKRKDKDEFTHMRYTAATCDPSEFEKQNYKLRQNLLGRETELFIVLTMYNVSQKEKAK